MRPDFARRVSEALNGRCGRGGVRGACCASAALGSVIAAGVAGAAIVLLRDDLPVQEEAVIAAEIPHAKYAVAGGCGARSRPPPP